MSRPDPIEYAERLYGAIRAANFSPMSFLAFGNAVKEGVAMRSMPRIAAEPFMRIVGEMLEFEKAAGEEEIIDADAIDQVAVPSPPATHAVEASLPGAQEPAVSGPTLPPEGPSQTSTTSPSGAERRRNGRNR